MKSKEQFETKKPKVRMLHDAQAATMLPIRRMMHCPLFFNANGSALPIEGMLQGSAFLVLNGPSVAARPVAEFVKGSYVMTVNNGPRTIRGNANVMLDGPDRFSLSAWLDPLIAKFVPFTHLNRRLFDNRLIDGVQRWEWSKMRVADCPNVIAFKRNDNFNPDRFFSEPSINWGCSDKNGGGRSVMLSAIRILHVLGFRTIYLVGADFSMDADNRYHFPMGKNEKSAAGNNATYKLLDERFKALSPALEKSGCKIWNCTPNSRLTAFPSKALHEAAFEARAEFGVWVNEKVDGMYEDADKKKLL